MSRTILKSANMYAPKFRYSTCVKTGPWYSMAGLVGLDPTQNKLVLGGPYAESRQILKLLATSLPDWGLGLELKGDKPDHWSGSLTAPATYGHFGGSGTFLWVDPERRLACAVLTTRPFGEWAKAAWPPLCDAVIRELGH